MKQTLSYSQRSSMTWARDGNVLHLSPDRGRESVCFDAPLRQPMRFRQAMAAFHAMLMGGATVRKGVFDRAAYRRWRRERPPAADRHARTRYWDARIQYGIWLLSHDHGLWRTHVPYDPVVTVAADALVLEGFASDASCYASLSATTGAFGETAEPTRAGTTTVDYSPALAEALQTLRTYRPTRLRLAEAAREDADHGAEAETREETIRLRSDWLRSLAMVQGAMALPMRRVELSREAIYSVLAFLRRHRAHRSPRAIRFELTPGSPARIVLEPWEQVIDVRGPAYQGPAPDAIRIWGRNQLSCLDPLLSLAQRFEVRLLGTGMPSFWMADMGALQFCLGISGWIGHDWSTRADTHLLAAPVEVPKRTVGEVGLFLKRETKATLAEVAGRFGGGPAAIAALHQLAQRGQVLCDLAAGLYRWRPMMPQPLAGKHLGSEHPAVALYRKIRQRSSTVHITHRVRPNEELELVSGRVMRQTVEVLLDLDRRIRRGACQCGGDLRSREGPCGHMLALRAEALTPTPRVHG